MPRFWIDIENAAGAQQGAGPIATATSWESTARLDRSGVFRFSMPASDDRAAIIVSKYIAKCYTLVGDVVTLMGAGIIDKIATSVDNRGQIVLDVSGDDLGKELTYRHVGALVIDDGAGGADVTAPADIIALAPAGWTLDTTRGFNSTLKAILHTFEGETVLAAFVRLADMTGEHFYATSSKTVVWIRATGSAKLTHAGITAGPFTMGETVTGGTSGATGLVQEATGGVGAGYLYVEDVTADFVAGETVTGGASGASITVTVAYNPSSGIRAVQGVSGVAMETNTDICLIRTLEEVQDSYDIATRIYPYGVGDGDARITLTGTAWTETGYTIDTVNNYIERDDGVTDFGRIDRYENFKDIDNADLLAESPYEWLRRYSFKYYSYRLRDVDKLDAAISPGEWIRVICHRWIVTTDGTRYHAVNIDDDNLVVLETTTRIDNNGSRTSSFQFANLPRYPETRTAKFNKRLAIVNDYLTHSQPVDAESHAATHQNGGADEISVAELSGELADPQPTKDHKSEHEVGGGDVLSGNLSITDLALSGKVTQATQTISAFFTKDIVDAAATSIFRIATTNEAGDTDGGGYSVWVHALIDHSCTSDTTNAAAVSFTAQFCRVMIATGTGANSAVSEVVETVDAYTNILRTIGVVTMTVLETSGYLNDVQFNVDLAGLGVGAGKVHVWVQLVYAGFTTPPVMSQL